MQTKLIERYFFFGLLLLTLIFTFMIFRPFWVVLVLGGSFAVVLYPIYEWWKRRKLPDWLSAALTLILFLILLCGPVLGIGSLVFNQSQNIYHSFVKDGNTGTFLNSVNNSVSKILPPGINFDIKAKIATFISSLSNNITSIFSVTFTALLSFILMLLVIFYSLKEGAYLRKSIVILSPLDDKDDEQILTRLSHAINGVIKGYLLIALAQGLLMGLGLWFFHVPNPALWGVVAAFSSLIPGIGTGLVSVPAVIFLFATGNIPSAIGMLAWAILLVGTIDNFLTPFVVSGKTNVSPFVILFSILGGISLLGPVGILMGPLTISLLYTLILIYRNEYKQSQT